MADTFRLVCPCLLGLEGPVAAELRALGAEEVEAQNGRVLCKGNLSLLARMNLCVRYGERVLIEMGRFRACSFEELFESVKALPWERWIGKTDAFPVKGSSLNSQLRSVPDCQAILKKAIVERLRGQYHVNWFAETGPCHQVQFLILKDEVSVMLDTSGAGLYKRGYRTQAGDAPIKETLAAAMAYLSRVRPDSVLRDPFCGSGTLLIEGALYAKQMAPGLLRRFRAEQWEQIPAKVWREERERAQDLIRRDVKFQAIGSDIDAAAVALTLENARRAGVAASLRASVRDIAQFQTEEPNGSVICNPPYGERLLDLEQAHRLYQAMGKVFVPQSGWNYTIISSDPAFESHFGRPADRRRKLYNGMIPCQLYMYFKSTSK